jgi:putative ABC transport system permease protein
MIAQHIKEAKQSLKTRPGLSLLVVLTMGIGIALLMTMLTTVYQQMRVPVPHLSHDRYLVLADARPVEDDRLLDAWQLPSFSWNDAQQLLNMDAPIVGQSINFTSRAILEVDEPTTRPVWAEGVATDNAFFRLFDAPFLFGGPWNQEANMSGEAVMVISKELNNTLFGGENSVGRMLNAQGVRTTIIGVMDDWPIKATFYDRSFSDREMHHMFIPLGFAIQSNLMRSGAMYCLPEQRQAIGDVRRDDITRLMASDCGWINLWVHMNSTGDAQEYKAMLEQFIQQQKALGRYPREEPDHLVANLKDVVVMRGADDWSRTLLVMAYLFFGVCLVNTVGILLGKFLNQSKRVSIYRALGASKSYILKQYLIEVLFLGFIGGLIGLLLANLGLEVMFQVEMYQSDYDGDPKVVKQYFTLDWQLVFIAIAVSISSIVVAGLYPIWKICNIPPASQLKL